MPLFQRASLNDRAQTWDFTQPIRAIDSTPTGIGLLVKEKWLRCSWEEIHNAVLLQKEVFMTRRPLFFRATFRFRTPAEAIALMEQRKGETDARARKLRTMGISTREILSFYAFDRLWSINLSSAGFHFEQNDLLRSILLTKLHPTIKKRTIFSSPGMWLMGGIAIFIIFSYVYTI